MRIGANLITNDTTISILDVAPRVEAAGLDSIFQGEHSHIPVETVFPMFDGVVPDFYKRFPDLFVMMAAAAALTTRLRLGTGVVLVAEHQPLRLAKAVASLDALSGGRVDFGVGYGWNGPEMANNGVDPAKRGARVPREPAGHPRPVVRRRRRPRRRVHLVHPVVVAAEAGPDGEPARAAHPHRRRRHQADVPPTCSSWPTAGTRSPDPRCWRTPPGCGRPPPSRGARSRCRCARWRARWPACRGTATTPPPAASLTDAVQRYADGGIDRIVIGVPVDSVGHLEDALAVLAESARHGQPRRRSLTGFFRTGVTNARRRVVARPRRGHSTLQRAVHGGHGGHPARLRHRRGRPAHARRSSTPRCCRCRPTGCSRRCCRSGPPSRRSRCACSCPSGRRACASSSTRAPGSSARPAPVTIAAPRSPSGARSPWSASSTAWCPKRCRRRSSTTPSTSSTGCAPTAGRRRRRARSCSSASRPAARSPCSACVALREQGRLGDGHRRHRPGLRPLRRVRRPQPAPRHRRAGRLQRRPVAGVPRAHGRAAPGPVDLTAVRRSSRSLPPALFSVGTADALIDDTLFMYERWMAAGNDAPARRVPRVAARLRHVPDDDGRRGPPPHRRVHRGAPRQPRAPPAGASGGECLIVPRRKHSRSGA